MLVFFLFYKLVLEREKMHHINRFLLLFALVFSVLIPFVDIEYISENPVIIQSLPSYIIPEISIGSPTVETSTMFTTKNILWLLYGLGFSLFLSRFIKNLASLLRNIHESEKIKYDGFTLVLTTEKILPHSFWDYVFVNRDEYKNNQVDKELLVHEKAHIVQKHSVDILFVELLQIVFWFHPMVYFYKKAIKLNHEFLADQAVNDTFKEVAQYQKLLLQKTVGNSLVPIASNLNYSVTKKRFIMMTKNQSKLMTISKSCFTLLLFGAMFFTFSVKGQEENSKTSEDKYLILNENKGKSKEVSQEEFEIAKQNEEQEDKVHIKVDVRPEYEGGIQAFYEYIKKNLKIPEVEKDVKENVIVSFIVEKDGSLSNIKILRDPVGMEKEVIEMLEACPKWKPGTQDGKPVRVEYTLPLAVSIKAAKK